MKIFGTGTSMVNTELMRIKHGEMQMIQNTDKLHEETPNRNTRQEEDGETHETSNNDLIVEKRNP